MIPSAFDYVRPPNLGAALKVLREREGDAKLLAGGYSLLPLLKLRLAQPALLVDLRDVEGLDGIVETETELRIGGRATHRRIHEDPAVARYSIVHEAAGGIGDPQVRNWGTIGGSCAHADPSSDWPAVLLAARATIVVRSEAGERTIAARDFFLDTFQTAIEPTEILTEIRIPRPGARTGGTYQKLERRAGDFATVGVAARIQLGADGRIESAGIGLTAVAETPFAATDAEAALVGTDGGDAAIAAASAAAAAQSSPATDSHGPAAYKRAMVAEMTTRALRLAIARARGQA
ncbi:MAG: FAD binding domain-containing protein [Candidatus Limnocylindrales bacterium]